MLGCSLESLNLIYGLITIFVDLIHSFDHSVQISALNSELLFKFQIYLFKDDSFASHLVDLFANDLVLGHSIVISLVSLVKTILYYLRLLAKLGSAILVRARGASHRGTLFPFLLNDFPLHVLDLFIDPLTSLRLPINLLYQLLDLLLLYVSSLLCDILLLDLLGHLHLLHLKLLEKLVILHL